MRRCVFGTAVKLYIVCIAIGLMASWAAASTVELLGVHVRLNSKATCRAATGTGS